MRYIIWKKLHRNLKLSLLSGIHVAIPIFCQVYCRTEMSEHILMLFLSRILTVGEERSKYATGGKKNPEKRRIVWYWIRITNISVGGFFF